MINWAAQTCSTAVTKGQFVEASSESARRLLGGEAVFVGGGEVILIGPPNRDIVKFADAVGCPRSAGSGGMSLYKFDAKTAEYVEAYVLPVTLQLTCERAGSRAGVGEGGGGQSVG